MSSRDLETRRARDWGWLMHGPLLLIGATMLLPLVFILLCWAMVKFIYRDISLEDDDAA